jgi:hypothetical protein
MKKEQRRWKKCHGKNTVLNKYWGVYYQKKVENEKYLNGNWNGNYVS